MRWRLFYQKLTLILVVVPSVFITAQSLGQQQVEKVQPAGKELEVAGYLVQSDRDLECNPQGARIWAKKALDTATSAREIDPAMIDTLGDLKSQGNIKIVEAAKRFELLNEEAEQARGLIKQAKLETTQARLQRLDPKGCYSGFESVRAEIVERKSKADALVKQGDAVVDREPKDAIGFYSSARQFDAEYLGLDQKTSHARNLTEMLSGNAVHMELEARVANGAPGNIPAKMQLPWFYSAPNVGRVDLAMEIVPTAMRFQKEKGKLHGEFDLAGAAYRPDGTVAARISDTAKLDFDNQQQVDAFLKVPYHYENQFEVAPGQYTFRMAFSSGDQGFGMLEMPLEIEPWDGQTLSASALALSRNAHPAGGPPVSSLQNLRPLIVKGADVVPTGTSQFHTGERGFFYLEVYEPLLIAAKPGTPLPVVGVRIRILDRVTGQQKEDTGVKTAGTFMLPGNPVVPILLTLPTTTLPAGAYKLEVSVMRQTGDPVVRAADFDVN